MAHPHFVSRHVLPAETQAIVRAQRAALGVGIGYRFDIAVLDLLDVKRNRGIRQRCHGDAGAIAGGNIKCALLRKQPRVLVEFLHLGLALV